LGSRKDGLETHLVRSKGVYEDHLSWIVGVKVEIKKSKKIRG
jgi:hypothetical protein